MPSLNSRDRALLASHVAKIATSGVASNIQLEACKFVIDLFGEKNRKWHRYETTLGDIVLTHVSLYAVLVCFSYTGKVPLQAIVASGAVQKAVHLVMTRSCKSEEVQRAGDYSRFVVVTV